MAWRGYIEQIIYSFISELQKISQSFKQSIDKLSDKPEYKAWLKKIATVGKSYEELKNSLAGQGINDPAEFGRLVAQSQDLSAEIKQFESRQTDKDDLIDQIRKQEEIILTARSEITEARKAFLNENLSDNEFVKIDIVSYGYDPLVIEKQLRELLDITDNRFEKDILENENNQPSSGLVQLFLENDDRQNNKNRTLCGNRNQNRER